MFGVYVLLPLLLMGLRCTLLITCVHTRAYLSSYPRSQRLILAFSLHPPQQSLPTQRPSQIINPIPSSSYLPPPPHLPIDFTRSHGVVKVSNQRLASSGRLRGDPPWSSPLVHALKDSSRPPLNPRTFRDGRRSRWVSLPLQRQNDLHPTRLHGMLPALNMVSVRRYRVIKETWPLSVATASSAIVRRNNKKKQLAEDYAPMRKRYLHNIKESKSLDERIHWQMLLQQLPRDSSPTRYRRRCLITGRARGVYRHFGLCRHKIKEMIDNLEIPGWTKAEW